LAINHVFTGIPVADYHAALAWYERFLGRPPDVIVTDSEAMWQVAETGWIYVVGETPSAPATSCSRSSWTTWRIMSRSSRNEGLVPERSTRCQGWCERQ
jgi:hypothetical protein